MQKRIGWKGLYYDSKENCLVDFSDQGIAIKSIITGRHDTVNYHAEYAIKTTATWTILSFDITYILSEMKHHVAATHKHDGWIVNGQARPEFKNCVDIDITLTPFTNSLPINRLKLPLHATQQIEVLYVDILKNTIGVAHQQYTKKSDTEYNFQNVPNDFEANLTVDANGFIKHYPKLFKRNSDEEKLAEG